MRRMLTAVAQDGPGALALWAAHALAWAAGVWLVVGPVVEVNHWPTVVALLIPILLTGLALVLVYSTSRWRCWLELS